MACIASLTCARVEGVECFKIGWVELASGPTRRDAHVLRIFRDMLRHPIMAGEDRIEHMGATYFFFFGVNCLNESSGYVCPPIVPSFLLTDQWGVSSDGLMCGFFL